MAKQVQVLIICDWCKSKWQEVDEEAPQERDWTWNGGNFVVELCGPCRDKVRDFLQPLFEASEQKKRTRRPYGSNPRKMQKGSNFSKYLNAEGRYECPFVYPPVENLSGEVKCSRSFEYPQHLGNHHRKTHGDFL